MFDSSYVQRNQILTNQITSVKMNIKEGIYFIIQTRVAWILWKHIPASFIVCLISYKLKLNIFNYMDYVDR